MGQGYPSSEHQTGLSKPQPPTVLSWVRTRKPQGEHNESGLPPITDMERTFRLVR